MRRTLGMMLLATLTALALAPGAAAHGGEHANHLSVRVDSLAAGQERTFDLAFENGSFAAGWVFLAYGGVQSNQTPVLVSLTLPDGSPVADWVWSPGGFHVNTTRLPQESEYRLALTNPSQSEEVSFAFYYDQSCECLDKTVGLRGGPVIFNTHVAAGRTVDFDLEIAHWDTSTGGLVAPTGVRTDLIVATLSDERALWPDDFSVIDRVTTDGAALSVSWTAQTEGVHYVWVTVLEGADPNNPVFLRPRIDIVPGGEPMPAPGLFLVAAVLAAALVVARRSVKGTR